MLHDPALHELLAEGNGSDEVSVILRLRSPGQAPTGARIVARFRHIVTARVERQAVFEVRNSPLVCSLKAAKWLEADLELEEMLGADENASPDETANERRAPGLEATGLGVVIGFVDWGCDFTHPDFRHADGRTRLLALWDQRASGGEDTLPYGYGQIHSSDRIDAALLSADPYAALGYRPADTAHGTHTLGIAAGNGRGGGPVGVAPEADLVFVHMGSRQEPGSAPLGSSTDLLEAIDFISGVAGDRPCVVNLSLGQHAGEHTGHSPAEQALDEWTELRPGRAVVLSCGNYFGRNTHASWRLRPGEELTFRMLIDPHDRTPNELDLWYPGRDRLGVEIRAVGLPDGQVLTANAAPGERAAAGPPGQETLRLYHRQGDPNNGDHQVSAYLDLVPGVTAWDVRLVGEDIQDGRIHAWIERDSGCPGCQAKFPSEEADVRSTLGSVCTGFRTLAVGAYDRRRADFPVCGFSSSGLTRDGRQKPDLSAPGRRVRSARSNPGRNLGSPPDPADLYTLMSGTSMACPHVTGTVALMFQAGGPLDIATTHMLLLSTCDLPPDSLEDPPDRLRLGNGYLNTLSAVSAAREHRARQVAQATEEKNMTYPVPQQTLQEQDDGAGPPSDVDPEQTLYEFAETVNWSEDPSGPLASGPDGTRFTDEAGPDTPPFFSDVDADLTAFEFAETVSVEPELSAEEQAEPWRSPQEPVTLPTVPLPCNCTPSTSLPTPPARHSLVPLGHESHAAFITDALDELDGRLRSDRAMSPTDLLLAMLGRLDPLFRDVVGSSLLPRELFAAFGTPGGSALGAALSSHLTLVGEAGTPLAGLRQGDLLVQRPGGGPLTTVSVVREHSGGVAPVWRAAGGPVQETRQRALDPEGRVRPHTLVLRPEAPLVRSPGTDDRAEGEWVDQDWAESTGPCPDVPVPPGSRPALLIRGSVHPAVREAQRKLNAFFAGQRLRGGAGLADGPLQEDCIFGPLTQQAVLAFQRTVFPGQPAEQDGKIGPHTWAQLDAVGLPSGPTRAALVSVTGLELLDDRLSRLLTWDDVIGLDLNSVNLRLTAGGLPTAALPTEIRVLASSRPPNGDAGSATLDPATELRLSRTGPDPARPGQTRYELSRTLSSLGAFGAVERRVKEVATVVRPADHLPAGSSDAVFRSALGWAPRGHSTQARAVGVSTGSAATRTPDALQLMRSGGLEVLEITVPPTPGMTVTAPPVQALVRSPADVMYYSGHGLSVSNCLAVHTSNRPHDDYQCWLQAADLATVWRSPMDLDVLVIAGCSVLRTDFSGSTASGNGLEWARLLSSKGGPLRAILGYAGSAPADSPVGDQIARELGAKMAAGSTSFARDWMDVNAAHHAWNAAAIDLRGYWDFEAGLLSHSLRGPRALP